MSDKDRYKEGERKVSGLKTIIGKGTHIEGKVSIQSSGRIDGIIIGELISTETLVIGEDGDIKGDVISPPKKTLPVWASPKSGASACAVTPQALTSARPTKRVQISR